jgi:hypothetical protein
MRISVFTSERKKMATDIAHWKEQQALKKLKKAKRSQIQLEFKQSLLDNEIENSAVAPSSQGLSKDVGAFSETHSAPLAQGTSSLAFQCYREAHQQADGFNKNSILWIGAWLGFYSNLAQFTSQFPESGRGGQISLSSAKTFYKARMKLWHPDVWTEQPESSRDALVQLSEAFENFEKYFCKNEELVKE